MMPSSIDAAPPDSSPSLLARVLAFSAVCFAGVCGGLIGYAVTDVSCDEGCTTAAGFVGLASAVGAAGGVSVVTVLTLRAMAEWRAAQPEQSGQSRTDDRDSS